MEQVEGARRGGVSSGRQQLWQKVVVHSRASNSALDREALEVVTFYKERTVGRLPFRLTGFRKCYASIPIT